MTIKNELDSYWRLDTYDEISKHDIYQRLRQLGFDKVDVSFSKSDLVSILHRHATGRLCYDSLSDADLRSRIGNRIRWGIGSFSRVGTFMTRRGAMTRAGRRRLVTCFEEEDDTFERFLDLPAELRNRVYEYYVAGFPPRVKLPTKPPLSRTCRLLMQEVLPIFYANLDFEIDLQQQGKVQYVEKQMTQLFLMNLAPADIACIRKLTLGIHRHKGFNNIRNHQKQMWFHIDLGLKQCLVTVQQSSKTRLEQWWPPYSLQILQQLIEEMISSLDDSSGKKTFTLKDIHSLRMLVEKEARLAW